MQKYKSSNPHHKLFLLVCTPNCGLPAAGPMWISVFTTARNANIISYFCMHMALSGPLGCASVPDSEEQPLLRRKRFCISHTARAVAVRSPM